MTAASRAWMSMCSARDLFAQGRDSEAYAVLQYAEHQITKVRGALLWLGLDRQLERLYKDCVVPRLAATGGTK